MFQGNDVNSASIIQENSFKNEEIQISKYSKLNRRLDEKINLSVIRRNLDVSSQNVNNDGSNLNTIFHKASEVPSIVHLTKPRFILSDNEFEITLMLERSLKIEYTIMVNLYQSTNSLQQQQICSLNSQSAYNQHYDCKFSGLPIIGEYSLNYQLARLDSSNSVSEIVQTDYVLTVIDSDLGNLR